MSNILSTKMKLQLYTEKSETRIIWDNVTCQEIWYLGFMPWSASKVSILEKKKKAP